MISTNTIRTRRAGDEPVSIEPFYNMHDNISYLQRQVYLPRKLVLPFANPIVQIG